MKRILFTALTAALFVGCAYGQSKGSRKLPGEHPVKGYYRKDGTYVRPHTAGHGPLADKDSSSGSSGGGTSTDGLKVSPTVPTPTPQSKTWLPRPATSPGGATATPVVGLEDRYLGIVRALAKEGHIQYFLIGSSLHVHRESQELWDKASTLGIDLTLEPRIADTNPNAEKMQESKKELLNNLFILEKLAGLISSINPVPASCADIDQNLEKYGQAIPNATKQIRAGVESNNVLQVNDGQKMLADAQIYLNEATLDIKKHLAGLSTRKTYVPG